MEVAPGLWILVENRAPLSPPVLSLLFSSELPHLDDPSGALSSILFIIQLTESSFGKEDPDLEKKP
jgi:hypothetical protein